MYRSDDRISFTDGGIEHCKLLRNITQPVERYDDMSADIIQKTCQQQEQRTQYAVYRTRADEIERFVSELSKAVSEDFMSFEVTPGEEFLSVIITKIYARYAPQLSMSGTELLIRKYDDCFIFRLPGHRGCRPALSGCGLLPGNSLSFTPV